MHGTLDRNSMKYLKDDTKRKLEKLRQKLGYRLKDYPYLNNTWTLLRFLRAHHRDYKIAKKKIEKTLDLFDSRGINHLPQTVSTQRVSKVLHPRGLYYQTKNGFPVIVERLGQLNSENLKNCTTEEIRDFYLREFEYLVRVVLPMCSEQQNKRIEKVLLVIDLEGMNYWQYVHS